MRRYTFVMAVVIAVVAASAPLGQADPDSPLFCPADTILENDQVRVWFQGLKGQIKVFDKNRSDPEGGIYTYKTVGISEVRGDEVLAESRLDTAMPHNSICSVHETSRGLVLTYFVQKPVHDSQGGLLGEPGIRFVYTLDHTAQGAKFDLFVNNWPWGASDSELVFDFSVHSTLAMETAMNGIGFRDSEGNEHGYMDWAETARVVYEDDREDEALVQSALDAKPNEVLVRLHYLEVEAGYEDLDYDPWVGTGGYEIVDGRIVGDDWLDRLVPAPLKAPYHTAKDLLDL